MIDYNFDFKWLNMIFYKKSLFSRKDIINLLKNFGIGFRIYSNVGTINKLKNFIYEHIIKTKDISTILITCPDVPEQELIPLTKKLIKESYPNLPNYDDVFEIYQQLLKLDIETLERLYSELSSDEPIKEIIERLINENEENKKQFPDNYTKNHIIDFILESLYQAPLKQLTKEEITNYIKKLNRQ